MTWRGGLPCVCVREETERRIYGYISSINAPGSCKGWRGRMEAEPRSSALSVVCCSFGVTDPVWAITAGGLFPELAWFARD